MKNRWFSVEPAPENGGLKSLVLNNDPASMNWIEGIGTWGVPLDFRFLGMEKRGNTLLSRYQLDTLELEVTHTMEEELLRERFTFRNTGTFDLYFQRGGISLYATFNDSYESADVCIAERCHAHLWCGGENSYVHATKMSPFHTELALILTEGALDAYSVRRIEQKSSNDRGDFLLHPVPTVIEPGETRRIVWELFAFPEDRFEETLLENYSGVVLIENRNDTVFPGEKFELSVRSSDEIREAEVRVDDMAIPCRFLGKRAETEFFPERNGEYEFHFRINGVETPVQVAADRPELPPAITHLWEAKPAPGLLHDGDNLLEFEAPQPFPAAVNWCEIDLGEQR